MAAQSITLDSVDQQNSVQMEVLRKNFVITGGLMGSFIGLMAGMSYIVAVQEQVVVNASLIMSLLGVGMFGAVIGIIGVSFIESFLTLAEMSGRKEAI